MSETQLIDFTEAQDPGQTRTNPIVARRIGKVSRQPAKNAKRGQLFPGHPLGELAAWRQIAALREAAVG
jgi:hypothetical protein